MAAATMPTLNGTLAPPLPSSPTSTAKRKRRESEEQQNILSIVNAQSPSTTPDGISSSTDSGAQIREILNNIYQVLEKHDTTTTVLQHSIRNNLNHSSTANDEPHFKRARLTTTDATLSISDKIRDGMYTALEQFQEDVRVACAELAADLKTTVKGSLGDYTANQPSLEPLLGKLQGFEDLANILVRREHVRVRKRHAPTDLRDGHLKKSDEEATGHAVKQEPDTQANFHDVQPARTVLTLFGNAQGHKQLFSSFQKEPASIEDDVFQPDADSLLKNLLSPRYQLREAGLPNGIASTKIISITSEEALPRSKSSSFRDLFPPPPSLPPLAPPKTPRPALSRSNSITWAHPQAPVPQTTILHAQQRLCTGYWLGYDGVALPREPSSPEMKRKQRDRTLSMGEAAIVPSKAAISAQIQAKEEALFRSSYSSFAPSRDDSLAIYPGETRSQLWWQRIGSRYFDRIVAPQAQTNQLEDTSETLELAEEDGEAAKFKEAVDAFNPELYRLEQEGQKRALADKNSQELLDEVSEMLEMLLSYQRIRNSSLNATGRFSIRQNSPVQDLLGTPSMPSRAELETYNVLKLQLALIVSMLPPHAVAKLNGEQLEELNISSHIQLEDKTYRGTMEEDQAYRGARAATQAAIAPPAPSRTNTMSTPNALSSGQARTAPMTGMRAGVAAQNYGGGPPQLPKQSSSFSRQPLSAWQTPAQAQGYSNAGQRMSFTSSQNYGQQQTPRTGLGNSRTPMQQLPSARQPLQQANGMYGSGPSGQSVYPPRTQSYGTNSSNFGVKSPYTSHQQLATPSNRPAYTGPQTVPSQLSRSNYQPPNASQQPFSPPSMASPQMNQTQAHTPMAGGAFNNQPGLGPSMQMKQSQSPAPFASMGSANGTPQPKQEN